MSDFEQAAAWRVLNLAHEAGVAAPTGLAAAIVCGQDKTYPARWWAEQHPDDDPGACCYGSALDPDGCTCWMPVYEQDQQKCVPPASAADLTVRAERCGDCAYRPGSPELAEAWKAEMLLDLPARGQAFWCHDGIRRPVRWEHPDGRVVAGAADDYHPGWCRVTPGIPYQADGRPALLCAGWAAIAARTTTTDGAANVKS